jgi:predicted  nucleic acid-binding Zn-ribbon protein
MKSAVSIVLSAFSVILGSFSSIFSRKISSNEDILSSLKDDTFQSLHDDLKAAKVRMSTLSDEILEYGIKVGSLKEKTQSLSQKNI